MNAPSWLSRGKPQIVDSPAPETFVRDTINNLRASADLDTVEILASALNVYTAAIIRLRGNDIFHPSDITSLFAMWEILLDVTRNKTPDYTGGKVEIKPEDLRADQ